MAIYAYARVSTVRQADEGESLDVQQRVMAGYAQMHGLDIATTFVERGVSGSTPLGERPQGKALLTKLKPGDTVITPKLDRMFRSALDALGVLADLKAQGVALHMIDLGGDVTTNGVSKLVFTILSAVAEAERDRIRERVGEVKRDQKARGHYLGGIIPFGYRLVGRKIVDGVVVEKGRLEADAEQQQAIQSILNCRAKGMPLRAIKMATGTSLSIVAISRICKDAAVD